MRSGKYRAQTVCKGGCRPVSCLWWTVQCLCAAVWASDCSRNNLSSIPDEQRLQQSAGGPRSQRISFCVSNSLTVSISTGPPTVMNMKAILVFAGKRSINGPYKPYSKEQSYNSVHCSLGLRLGDVAQAAVPRAPAPTAHRPAPRDAHSHILVTRCVRVWGLSGPTRVTIVLNDPMSP